MEDVMSDPYDPYAPYDKRPEEPGREPVRERDNAWIAAIVGVLVVLGLVLWFSDWSHLTRTASNSPPAIEKVNPPPTQPPPIQPTPQ
jgi:hypothetical protein